MPYHVNTYANSANTKHVLPYYYQTCILCSLKKLVSQAIRIFPRAHARGKGGGGSARGKIRMACETSLKPPTTAHSLKKPVSLLTLRESGQRLNETIKC